MPPFRVQLLFLGYYQAMYFLNLAEPTFFKNSEGGFWLDRLYKCKMSPEIKKWGWPGVFVSKMLKDLPMNQWHLPLLDVLISITIYYKNSVNQEAGWNSETISCCKHEAERQNLKNHDYWGSFVID